MRYDLILPETGKQQRKRARVTAHSEITYLAWVIEGEGGEYSLTWRNWGRANRILDPMQISAEDYRVIIGDPLLVGKVLVEPEG